MCEDDTTGRQSGDTWVGGVGRTLQGRGLGVDRAEKRENPQTKGLMEVEVVRQGCWAGLMHECHKVAGFAWQPLSLAKSALERLLTQALQGP